MADKAFAKLQHTHAMQTTAAKDIEKKNDLYLNLNAI